MIDVTVQTLFPHQSNFVRFRFRSDIESTLHYCVIVVNIVVPAARSLKTSKLNKKSERENLQHVSQFSHCRVLLLIQFFFFYYHLCVSLFFFFFYCLGYRTLLWVFGHVPGSLIEAAEREVEQGGRRKRH